MAKNIEFKINTDGVMAIFDKKEISLGNPESLAFNIFHEGRFKLSSVKDRKLKIIYPRDIPEKIESSLFLLSEYFGIEGSITSAYPLYGPEKRDMYQIDLPEEVTLSLKYCN